MKKMFIATAVFLGLSPAGLLASTFAFTFDIQGNIGSGVLNAVPSGLGDDSLLAVSGTLNWTTSSDGNASAGTYSLLPAGPGVTSIGAYIVDDLIYPNNDAGSGSSPCQTSVGAIGNPSYLT